MSTRSYSRDSTSDFVLAVPSSIYTSDNPAIAGNVFYSSTGNMIPIQISSVSSGSLDFIKYYGWYIKLEGPGNYGYGFTTSVTPAVGDYIYSLTGEVAQITSATSPMIATWSNQTVEETGRQSSIDRTYIPDSVPVNFAKATGSFGITSYTIDDVTYTTDQAVNLSVGTHTLSATSNHGATGDTWVNGTTVGTTSCTFTVSTSTINFGNGAYVGTPADTFTISRTDGSN